MDLLAFIQESNRIEGIERPFLPGETAAYKRFLALDYPTVRELEGFVETCQPGAVLRSKPTMNVRVGAHHPPNGGPAVLYGLAEILANLEELHPYQNHVRYETLHPFTDCNGRSGRVLWLWQMLQIHTEIPLGFLHTWYYQSLQASRS